MAAIKPRYSCSLGLAMDLVGGKWKMPLLWHLRNGAVRFSALRRKCEGITQKMLTQQLRELEEYQLVTRTVYSEASPRVEYALTDAGRSLIPALGSLCAWANAYTVQYAEIFDFCCDSVTTHDTSSMPGCGNVSSGVKSGYAAGCDSACSEAEQP